MQDHDVAPRRATVRVHDCAAIRPSAAAVNVTAIERVVQGAAHAAGIERLLDGAVGALAYDAVSIFEPHVPLPDRDPVGVPTAAFIETDLVLQALGRR